MPRGSDATFAAKLQAAHAAHPRFGCPARAPGPAFTIRHFAGPVTYSAALFLDKNRDMLSRGGAASVSGGGASGLWVLRDSFYSRRREVHAAQRLAALHSLRLIRGKAWRRLGVAVLC
jgi:hypothetical protein